MKAIILASGKGTRLGNLTKNTPKPLIDLGNGKTILETQLENMRSSNVVDKVVIIVGYHGDQIEAKVKKYNEESFKIKVLYNPFYDFTNNLITLWLAHNEMDEDFIITNGDNIFEKEVFKELIKNNTNGIFLTTTAKENYSEDDMKVILSDEVVERVSKSIQKEQADAESVGLSLISGEKSRNIFRSTMCDLIRDPSYLNKFWLEVFNKISERGGIVREFKIDRGKWKEFDVHLDLKDLLDLIRENRKSSLFVED